MRPPAAEPRPTRLVRRYGEPGGEPAVVVVHPGALPAGLHASLADALALAATDGAAEVVVVDLDQVPAYLVPAFTGGQPQISIAALTGQVAAALEAADAIPSGRPWVLAGWSFGGVVAHALIPRLPAEALPRRLALLDTIAPVPGYTKADSDLHEALILPWFAMYLGAKRDVAVPVRTPGAEDPPLELVEVLAAATAVGAVPSDTTLPGLRKVYQVFAAGLRRNNEMVAAHHPAPSPVPISLVRPRGSLLATPGPLGWEALTDQVEAVDCPGDHYSMLRDPAALDVVAGVVRSAVTAAPSPTAGRDPNRA